MELEVWVARKAMPGGQHETPLPNQGNLLPTRLFCHFSMADSSFPPARDQVDARKTIANAGRLVERFRLLTAVAWKAEFRVVATCAISRGAAGWTKPTP
jgi:hypothetical protein